MPSRNGYGSMPRLPTGLQLTDRLRILDSCQDPKRIISYFAVIPTFMSRSYFPLAWILAGLFALGMVSSAAAQVGVGAQRPAGAELLFDGTREMLDEKWTYWDGPCRSAQLPIKWSIVDNPVGPGTAVSSNDPYAAGGKYGAADIVTKKKYRDFRLHVEFMVMRGSGNSGVYLQNRYEIQIVDGEKTQHGMAAVINETESPYELYRGLQAWNSYDIRFRAARFENGELVEQPRVTMYFNGEKVHVNQPIQQVHGGVCSGLDGGNDGGEGITDRPGGLKLQAEGYDVRYRNVWIKELEIEEADTDF